MNPAPEAAMGQCIALLGAECTGKSTLAQALCAHLQAHTDLRCTVVDEHLRSWCQAQGRTPQPQEQVQIARMQAQRIEAACQNHDVVLADTTAYMTALYSELIFDDSTLWPWALTQERQYPQRLLLTPDLPWQADGIQRDGPEARRAADRLLCQRLRQHGLSYARIGGSQQQRLDQALRALRPWLNSLGAATSPDKPQASGLFSRLLSQDALAQRPWRCELCDDPSCEQASWQQRHR
ncbi:AAA family ATPase [Roseateles sp. BYS180W]|uniref:AAA family ATPase n=1 Tax=Roseateles rivi TaxID=3299028 RepID=A0ABW7FVD9_9BURK